MAENQTLRTLLRGLSGFIGDGAGGLLSKMGWDMGDFEKFINRSETDTVYESHQLRKKGQEGLGLNGIASSSKRAAPDSNLSFDANKRRRASDPPETRQFSMPLMQMPLSNPVQDPNMNGTTLFSDLMGQTGSPLFMTQANAPFQSAPPNPYNQSAFLPPVRIPNGEAASPTYLPSNASSSEIVSPQRPPSADQEENDPKNDEAFKLMQ